MQKICKYMGEGSVKRMFEYVEKDRESFNLALICFYVHIAIHILNVYVFNITLRIHIHYSLKPALKSQPQPPSFSRLYYPHATHTYANV